MTERPDRSSARGARIGSGGFRAQCSSWFFAACLAIVSFCFGQFAAAPAYAQEDILERAVKATFLYKFVPFVQWPADSFPLPDAPVDICVVGTDPFGEILDEAVAGQSIAEHPIRIHRFDSWSEDAVCHVLFVSGPQTSDVLESVRGMPVLTITDSADGMEAEGIIHFVVEADRVSFDIDAVQAQMNGLTVSARLLALARMVRSG